MTPLLAYRPHDVVHLHTRFYTFLQLLGLYYIRKYLKWPIRKVTSRTTGEAVKEQYLDIIVEISVFSVFDARL